MEDVVPLPFHDVVIHFKHFKSPCCYKKVEL